MHSGAQRACAAVALILVLGVFAVAAQAAPAKPAPAKPTSAKPTSANVVRTNAAPATAATAPGAFAFDYCTTCHGTAVRGNPAIAAPRLAGLDAPYIAAQLRAYRAGWRGARPDDAPGQEMRRIALALADDAAVARAAREVVHAWHAPVQPDTSRVIATAYAPCAGCHGARGEGVSAPALSQQASWYLRAQLLRFRAGTRGEHPDDLQGAQMRAVVRDVSAADIETIAASLGGTEPVQVPQQNTMGEQR